MPELSRFYGIVVQVFYGDHPPAHFHVEYAGAIAKIDIETLSVISSSLSAQSEGLGHRMGRNAPRGITRGFPKSCQYAGAWQN